MGKRVRFAELQMFGDWLVLSEVVDYSTKRGRVLVSDGLETKYVDYTNLTRGLSLRSRTAFHKRSSKEFGVGSDFYSRWQTMKQRCYNPKDAGYRWYGGRGIKVSEEFLDSQKFCRYLGSLPREADQDQIDRIDNNGNYERGNLRWATPKENTNNRRNTK